MANRKYNRIKYSQDTKEAFIRSAKQFKTKIAHGANGMIPYYYRKKYGKK